MPSLPSTNQVKIEFRGTLEGKKIYETVNGTIKGEIELGQTFIQTDKYLYKPGQEVQFRILTTFGPFMKLSNDDVSKT